eukprot:TRINITY_DN2801_c0_g1_i1.p2 TRINITY_DN2801_c0_g1~~TRINITY_DN2801_c0_g1_i1.p2  ORF type:complete len:246 (+),score=52.04 TRINITY_DN2801_c0_g1_i1:636-1373(+)
MAWGTRLPTKLRDDVVRQWTPAWAWKRHTSTPLFFRLVSSALVWTAVSEIEMATQWRQIVEGGDRVALQVVEKWSRAGNQNVLVSGMAPEGWTVDQVLGNLLAATDVRVYGTVYAVTSTKLALMRVEGTAVVGDLAEGPPLPQTQDTVRTLTLAVQSCLRVGMVGEPPTWESSPNRTLMQSGLDMYIVRGRGQERTPAEGQQEKKGQPPAKMHRGNVEWKLEIPSGSEIWRRTQSEGNWKEQKEM